MSIIDFFNAHLYALNEDRLQSLTDRDVEAVLNKRSLSLEDLPVLLSPVAQPYLEEMAQRAYTLTRNHFGNTIQIFTPFYISNYCQNRCEYCSFSFDNKIIRKQLSFEQIEIEAKNIAKTGIRHVLVLTGEAETVTTFDYLKESLKIISQYFSSVAIEVHPLQAEQYKTLIEEAGVDALTLYQETYSTEKYKQYHTRGPKMDYLARLNTPEYAAQHSMRLITLGPLLGLDRFDHEVFYTALHLKYLAQRYPQSEFAVSFPRIRPLAGEFKVDAPITDRQYVQVITAFRILFPHIGITLSTREAPEFRDNLIPLGITKISAGVSTAVGGHTEEIKTSTTQFEIADHRDVDTMKADLLRAGFQPVMHDWNNTLNISTAQG